MDNNYRISASALVFSEITAWIGGGDFEAQAIEACA